MKEIALLIKICIYLIGIWNILDGVIHLWSNFRKHQKCTRVTMGHVFGVESVSYTVKGRLYTISDAVLTDDEIETGKVKVHYNPKRPRLSYLDGDGTSGFYILFTCIGILAVGITYLFI